MVRMACCTTPSGSQADEPTASLWAGRPKRMHRFTPALRQVSTAWSTPSTP